MISVLDPKREVGLWHSVLTVSTCFQACCPVTVHLFANKFSFCFNFTECDEWNACYLCAAVSFEERTSHVAADGNKTQRYVSPCEE